MTFGYKVLTLALVIGMQSIALSAEQPLDGDAQKHGVRQFVESAAADNARRSTSFKAAAQKLTASLTEYCDPTRDPKQSAENVQASWRAAQTAWDSLAALAVGALVTRASRGRSIDFMPARRDMLDRAVESAPKSLEALEKIGTPALGFGALELLLWPTAPIPGGPQCDYSVLAAMGIENEATVLANQFTKDASTAPSDEKARELFIGILNQWVVGTENLRWAFMRRPLEVANSRKQPPQYPRGLSGQNKSAWGARWATLRSFAIQDSQAARDPSEGPISFEALLRARKLHRLADELAEKALTAGRGATEATPQSPASVMAASGALGALSKLVMEKVAPALGVTLGFSDADGD